MILQLPTTLGGRYHVRRLLGSGSFAETLLAHDLVEERQVALKVLRPEYAGDPDSAARFAREARATERVEHPNIVQVLDHDADGDTLFLVMEYIPGPTLKRVIHQQGAMAVHQAIDLTREILAGLQAIHQAGVVHRDIKPHNILLTEDGTPKMSDFSIARAVDDTGMTGTGTALGTAAYMSPEQATGGVVGPTVDIYATGVILYELLTGRLPFTGDNPIEVIYQHVHEAPLPPSEVNKEITPQLESVILSALNKNPENRFQTADDMSDFLRSVGAVNEATVPVAIEGAMPSAAADAKARGSRAPARAAPPRRALNQMSAPATTTLVGTLLLLSISALWIFSGGSGNSGDNSIAVTDSPGNHSQFEIAAEPSPTPDPTPTPAPEVAEENTPQSVTESDPAPPETSEPEGTSAQENTNEAEPASDEDQREEEKADREAEREREKAEREAEREREKTERDREKDERESEREEKKKERETQRGNGDDDDDDEDFDDDWDDDD